MSGGIIDLSRVRAPASISADVCVVGSGCGGGTAARVLAEAGHQVVVLEEGGDFTGPRLTGRDAAMYDQLYMERGGRATDDLSVSVLQGRVLGGGGVINACDVVPAPDGVLEHWVRRFGLTDFGPTALRPYLERALSDLSASPIPEEMLTRNNRVLRQGARALGLRGEVMMHNRVGCEELGLCLVGCPADAKRNPRFVSIPKAVAAGARFYLRARAVHIEGARKELKRVRVRTLDVMGYHERGEMEVRAKAVVVAANAVATPQLLLRSGIGNGHVGRHLMLQPQLPIVAIFDEPVEAFDGIPQAYAVTEGEREDHPEHGLWGFRIEGIMGTPGMVASLLPYPGLPGKELMALYPRIAAALLLAPDHPSGRVELRASGRPRVRYTQREDHKERLRAAAKMAARIYLAAGARRILVPVLPPVEIRSEADLGAIDRISFATASAPLLSAHQQGGVRLAPSERDGAAAPDGQVYGTRQVYVMDASGFPSSASSHTMTPILTVSHFLARQLAEHL